MNPVMAYREGRASGWSRIDLLLALYDGAIDRMERACQAMSQGDTRAAAPLLLRSQRIVIELTSGLDLRYGDVPRNLEALYAFVLRAIASGRVPEIEGAIRVLRVLREGWGAAREEAIKLEQSGAITPADVAPTLRAIA